MNTFKSYHPIVNFGYFVSVIGLSMFFMHPVCLGISLGCSFIYAIKLKGRKVLLFNLIYMLPIMIITALINPLFNHEGATILTYFKNGNPLTLESVLYGVAAASMLMTVISWFSCYNEVMTSDKFIYLFGRIIPSLSLILSMTLRLVPEFKQQIKRISQAQRGIGRDISDGNILQRAKHGIRILSIMITWVLEDAINTADSMKSRGYGLKGRTAFSVYIMERKDIRALLHISIMTVYLLVGNYNGMLTFKYFPVLRKINMSGYSISLFIAYFLLCMTPVIIELWEEGKWKATRSDI